MDYWRIVAETCPAERVEKTMPRLEFLGPTSPRPGISGPGSPIGLGLAPGVMA